MKFVEFPDDFKAIKNFPGYFYNIVDKTLYSVKIGGFLKPLKKRKIFYQTYNGLQYIGIGWQISKNGRRYTIQEDEIENKLLDYHMIDRKVA